MLLSGEANLLILAQYTRQIYSPEISLHLDVQAHQCQDNRGHHTYIIKKIAIHYLWGNKEGSWREYY